MDSGSYTITISSGHPLSNYDITWDEPSNWESMIASLQNAYLQQNFSQSRNLNETLSQLENLIITNKYFLTKNIHAIEALTFATLNLEPLHKVFSDPDVTEIFGNKLGKELIISHRSHGRCRTNILFSFDFWQALKVRCELDSGLPLNSSNPALKIGIETKLGQFRISLQVPPLSTLGPLLSIRRLPQDSLNLEALEQQGQLPKIVREHLQEAVINRENIIIAGEPGSGKTTLANALLLKCQPEWRVIVLEDAREISLPVSKLPLLTHYNLPAVGSENRYSVRSNEIARLLHRSPDYVFLGEIQNKEDTEVAFEGFAAGLRGMATTHAKNFLGLRERWTFSHKLPADLVDSIDWVVITQKELERGVAKLSISELYNIKDGKQVKVFG